MHLNNRIKLVIIYRKIIEVVFGIIILLIILGALFIVNLFVFGSTGYTETNSESVEETINTSNNATLSSQTPLLFQVSLSSRFFSNSCLL
jgi:hypothetical protein